MLKPEQARQKLTELASPRHLEARVARLKKLPKAAAVAGLAALGRKPDGRIQPDYKEKKAGRMRGTAHLEAKPGDRAKVFAALFPTIAKEMEDAWQLFIRLPYTVGYSRRAFRAPTRPAAYRQLRSNWIEGVTNALANYPDDAISPEWIAAWSVHIDQAHWLGYLLAGVIDRGGATGDAVFEIVKDCTASRHEIGGPSRHVTRALLCCKRPEAWEFTENLLRAAQRQEGLRQTILEAVDEGFD